MLDHRKVKGGSNREAGIAKSFGLQSLVRAPSLENGGTGVSQVLGDRDSCNHFLFSVS